MRTFVRTVSASGGLVLSGLALLSGSVLLACSSDGAESEGPPPFSGALGPERPVMGSAQGGSGTQSVVPTPAAPGAAPAEQQGTGSPPLSSSPPNGAPASNPGMGNGAGGASGSAQSGNMMTAGSGNMPAAPASEQPMVETPVFTSPPVPVAPGAEAPLPQASFLTRLWSVGMPGTGPGMFDQVRGVGVDAAGNIFVVENAGRRVQRFDPEGRFLNEWIPSNETGVTGIAVTPSGQVYLHHFNSVARYDGATGASAGEVPVPAAAGLPRLVAPTGDEGVLVFSATHLLRFDEAGQQLLSVEDTWAEELSSSNNVRHATMDPEGNIYLVSTFDLTVFKFNSEGVLQTRVGAEGSGGGLFQGQISAVVLDSRGRIYASDFEGIDVFEPGGAPRALITDAGSVTAMVMSSRDELIILDNNASTLSKYAVTQ